MSMRTRPALAGFVEPCLPTGARGDIEEMLRQAEGSVKKR